jgi:hypothetical protein
MVMVRVAYLARVWYKYVCGDVEAHKTAHSCPWRCVVVVVRVPEANHQPRLPCERTADVSAPLLRPRQRPSNGGNDGGGGGGGVDGLMPTCGQC